MNLKEAFRYQKFLDNLMYQATNSITNREHSMKTLRTHRMNAANPEASDRVEEIIPDHPFHPSDDVIRFMQWLIAEKQKLSEAVGEAKASAGFDIDAAIETNKFRQQLNASVKRMLNFNGSTRIERGQGWKFNNEGVQSPYYYDLEVVTAQAFDKDRAREVMRNAIQEADAVSSRIDAALINCTVSYEPVFDVNDSFDDVMSGFLALS